MTTPSKLRFDLNASGAHWGDWQGSEAILHFGDPAAEEEALEGGVGIVPVFERTQLALRGEDRASFLHNLCTNDIRRLKPGEGCEAFLLNAQGKTLGHVYVFAEADQLVLDTVAGQAEFLLKHLDRFLIREKVELVPLPNRHDLLLAGPQALPLFAKFGVAPVPVEHGSQLQANIGDQTVSMRKVDLAGAESWLIAVDRTGVDVVWKALVDGGAQPSGMQAFEAARIAAGAPYFGQDITDANLPQEVNRNQQAISFTKGCYIGQETVARIDALGHVNRLLVGLQGTSDTALPRGLELTGEDGKPAGTLTSTAFSHRLNRPIALGYVRRAQANPGVKLQSAMEIVEVVHLPMA